MPYKGEVDEKGGEIGGGKGDARGNGGERNKDRMSYKCLGGKFTVDLTQVTSSFDVRDLPRFDIKTKENGKSKTNGHTDKEGA